MAAEHLHITARFGTFSAALIRSEDGYFDNQLFIPKAVCCDLASCPGSDTVFCDGPSLSAEPRMFPPSVSARAFRALRHPGHSVDASHGTWTRVCPGVAVGAPVRHPEGLVPGTLRPGPPARLVLMIPEATSGFSGLIKGCATSSCWGRADWGQQELLGGLPVTGSTGLAELPSGILRCATFSPGGFRSCIRDSGGIVEDQWMLYWSDPTVRGQRMKPELVEDAGLTGPEMFPQASQAVGQIIDTVQLLLLFLPKLRNGCSSRDLGSKTREKLQTLDDERPSQETTVNVSFFASFFQKCKVRKLVSLS